MNTKNIFFLFLFSFFLPFLWTDLEHSLLAQNTRLWGTCYGGTGDEEEWAITTDAGGNVYIAGLTRSANGISTAGSHQPALAGFQSAYVAKFNSAGVRQWATYYGGTNGSLGYDVAVDASGNVYLAGYTSSANAISTPGSHQPVIGGSQDAFLVKFDNAGVRQWATYYGGPGNEEGRSVAVDASGDVYLAGQTTSAISISTGGSHQPVFSGSQDDFLVKFNSAGVRQWATYYGGTGDEFAHSLVVDGSGSIYFSGTTTSTTAISTAGCHQLNNGGGTLFYDAFLVKFNAAGVRQWATYYGGTGYDEGYCVTADVSGNIYLAGVAQSATGISTPGCHQPAHTSATWNAYMVKFTTAGVRQWGTYYGGAAGFGTGDVGWNVATDGSGNVYLSGWTTATTAISTPGSHQPVFGGDFDAFLVEFNSAGVRQCATYYGGPGPNVLAFYSGWPMAVDLSGNIYLGGQAASATGISTAGSHQPIYGGGQYDVFLAKFISCTNNVLNVTATSTNIPCNGLCAGTATVTPVNGTSPYTYTWSNSQTTSAITGLCAGTYSVLVSDGASSTTTATVTITQPTVLTSTISSTNSNCSGASASASVTAAGGTASYTYSWSPSGGTSSTATGLSSGNYTATITDANGCTKTETVTLTQSPAITVSVTTNTASCLSSNGDATANPSGGTPGFTYSWNNGQTAQTATGLAAGAYTVTITDAAGCTQTALANISNTGTPQANISSTNNVSCNGGSNGSLVANVTVGTAPYTYSWNPSSQTTSAATNLSAGNYAVTITDANGCIVILSDTITEPSAITNSATATNTSCAGSTGTATANASGGTSGYAYGWSNGQTTQTATGLAQGNYTATITDANGCTQTQIVTITSANNNLSVIITSTQPGCTVNNGTATANASNGTPGYSYSWNNGQSAQTATGLAAGTYTATITDSNGCTQTQTVAVTSNNTLTVTTTSTQTGCTLSNGTASANASNGTPNYSYSWNNGQSSQTATGLAPGTYTATVTDASGCTQIQTASITQIPGPAVTANASPNTVISGSSSALIATGGGTYVWSPSASLSDPNISNPTATPSQTTAYCVVVTDNNGCQDSACITITVDIPCGTIYIPNAFSPNNDLENDLECVFGNCIEIFHIAIYNRWGEKVFESSSQALCWDGTHKGKPLNSAVFDYYMDAVLTTGEKIRKKGNISLIR